jgi:hypothetical protein
MVYTVRKLGVQLFGSFEDLCTKKERDRDLNKVQHAVIIACVKSVNLNTCSSQSCNPAILVLSKCTPFSSEWLQNSAKKYVFIYLPSVVDVFKTRQKQSLIMAREEI